MDKPRATKTNWVEMFSEIEWLLDGGVSPLLIPSIIGVPRANIEQACRRYGKTYRNEFNERSMNV